MALTGKIPPGECLCGRRPFMLVKDELYVCPGSWVEGVDICPKQWKHADLSFECWGLA